MQLHFLTRDIRNDYPRIGWLPALPKDASRLWEQFNEYGWQQSEYPQIILQQNNGEWQLFISGQESGRKDSSQGGRIVRVTFFLKGMVSESERLPLGLINVFLKETLIKTEENHIRDILLEKITNDAPTEWSQSTPDVQRQAADSICDALMNLPSAFTAKESPRRWFAGANKDNVDMFLSFCQDLMTGKRDGMALSLAFLPKEDITKLNLYCRNQNHLAALLSTETMLPVKELAPTSSPAPKPSPHRSPPHKPTGSYGNGSQDIKIYCVLALLVGVLIFIMSQMQSCWGLAGDDGSDKKVIPRGVAEFSSKPSENKVERASAVNDEGLQNDNQKDVQEPKDSLSEKDESITGRSQTEQGVKNAENPN